MQSFSGNPIEPSSIGAAAIPVPFFAEIPITLGASEINLLNASFGTLLTPFAVEITSPTDHDTP